MNLLNTKMLADMKTIELPNSDNLYSTLLELIRVFETICSIRQVQEKHILNPNPYFIERYNVLKCSLDKHLKNIYNYGTSLTYIADFINNRIEESKQLELIEKKHLSIKEQLKECYKKHYPTINNADTLVRIHSNAINGKYSHYSIRYVNGTIIYSYTTSKYVFVSVYCSTDYIIYSISWSFADRPSKVKIINELLHKKLSDEVGF